MLIKLSEDDNEAYFPASQALIPPFPPPLPHRLIDSKNNTKKIKKWINLLSGAAKFTTNAMTTLYGRRFALSRKQFMLSPIQQNRNTLPNAVSQRKSCA